MVWVVHTAHRWRWGNGKDEESWTVCPGNVWKRYAHSVTARRGRGILIFLSLFCCCFKLLAIPWATAEIEACQSEEDCEGRSCRMEGRVSNGRRQYDDCVWEINKLCFCSVSIQHREQNKVLKPGRLTQLSLRTSLTRHVQPQWQSEASVLPASVS